jgi:hypothetical protein
VLLSAAGVVGGAGVPVVPVGSPVSVGPLVTGVVVGSSVVEVGAVGACVVPGSCVVVPGARGVAVAAGIAGARGLGHRSSSA